MLHPVDCVCGEDVGHCEDCLSCERAMPATVLHVLSTEAGCVTCCMCQDFIHEAIIMFALTASLCSHAGVSDAACQKGPF